jgi:hypothetical protein
LESLLPQSFAFNVEAALKKHLHFITGERINRMKTRYLCAFLLFAQAVILTPVLRAQSSSTTASRVTSNSGGAVSALNFTPEYFWTEEFIGSTNSQGQVMSLDSTVGYLISRHVGVDGGMPVYFVNGTTTSSTGVTTNMSNDGIGDAYLQLRLAFPNPAVNYNMVLTGTVPTGSTADGFSTGHATYDWTNHFDRAFGRWTPFVELGLGNSIPENFVFNRPYSSYGHNARFQGGATYRIVDFLSIGASAYDVAPWGTQTIFSRVVGKGSVPPGKGGGPVFTQTNQATGGSNLAADNGVSVEADFSAGSLLDFSAGYSHSAHFGLDTFSFGIGVNMSQLLRHSRSGS